MGSWCSVKGVGGRRGGNVRQLQLVSVITEITRLNLNNLVPLANILRLIVVKLSFVVKGLLSDETKVACRWDRKTGKFGIR